MDVGTPSMEISYGNRIQMIGDFCTLYGNNSFLIGDYSTAFGNTNVIDGKRATLHNVGSNHSFGSEHVYKQPKLAIT